MELIGDDFLDIIWNSIKAGHFPFGRLLRQVSYGILINLEAIEMFVERLRLCVMYDFAYCIRMCCESATLVL